MFDKLRLPPERAGFRIGLVRWRRLLALEALEDRRMLADLALVDGSGTGSMTYYSAIYRTPEFYALAGPLFFSEPFASQRRSCQVPPLYVTEPPCLVTESFDLAPVANIYQSLKSKSNLCPFPFGCSSAELGIEDGQTGGANILSIYAGAGGTYNEGSSVQVSLQRKYKIVPSNADEEIGNLIHGYIDETFVQLEKTHFGFVDFDLLVDGAAHGTGPFTARIGDTLDISIQLEAAYPTGFPQVDHEVWSTQQPPKNILSWSLDFLSLPEITGFTNKQGDSSQVRIDYTVPQEGGQPFEIGFESSGNQNIATEFKVDPQSIFNNPKLSLSNNESPSDALKPGLHSLLVNIAGTDLEAKLLDDNIEVVYAFEKNEKDNVSFRGIYQASAHSPAVVRSGPNTSDDVLIELNKASFDKGKFSGGLNDPTSLLIVTASGEEDLITIVGTTGDNFPTFPPTLLWGGSGGDRYAFQGKVAGHFSIKEQASQAGDTLDFSAFKNGGSENVANVGVRLDLSNVAEQTVATGLLLTLGNEDAIEHATGSSQHDFIKGNARNNLLMGEDGNDLLVGDAGEDNLRGGNHNDLLIGDGFAFSRSRWEELANAVLTLRYGLPFSFGQDLIPTAGAKDIIDDGGGEDIVIGGDGDDVITGKGGTVVFGDSFQVTQPVTLDFSKIFTGFSIIVDLIPFELKGDGDDMIILDSGNNIVVGGDGDDTIRSTDGIDLLFGNRGRDEIDAGGGSNLIIGGPNPSDQLPEKLTAGDGGLNVIIGDDVTLEAQVVFNFTWTSILSAPLDVLVDASFKFKLDGLGPDDITVGNGSNLVFGGKGKDRIKGSATGGNNIFFGNEDTDTIQGGGEINFIVGGANTGDEEEFITGGEGIDLIFGDTIELDSGKKFSLPMINVAKPKESIAQLTGLFALFKPTGASNDNIKAGNGVNMVISGGGNDTVEGGDSIDLLFGNEGNDYIDGKNGFNFIVGGDGDDPMLQGGKDSDIVIGDEIGITSSLETFDPGDAAVGVVEGYVEKLLGFFKGPTETSKPSAFGAELKGVGNDTIELGDGLNLAFGGDGSDTITGGALGDVIFGGEGQQDRLFGQGGTDLIIGNEGNDEIRGGDDTAPNFLFGDNAALLQVNGFNVKSLLSGDLKDMQLPSFQLQLDGNGNDTIWGGNGFDFIVGGKGADTLRGGDGLNFALGDDFEVGPLGDIFSFAADLINPGKSATVTITTTIVSKLYSLLKGSAGKEDSDGTIDKDFYYGGNDVDIALGGSGDDELYGYGDFDFLIGGYGHDKVNAGEGGTLIEGEEFLWGFLPIDNVAYGGPGDDEFFGGDGNDLLFSDLGNDIFHGGGGDDVLIGGEGADRLLGEDGDDLLYGGADDDELYGGPGDDTLYGGPGDDLLDGGSGVNSLFPDDEISSAPLVTTSPSSLTVIAGATATFTAAATGSPTPTVQWQVSTDNGATFTNISGATETTLSLTAAMTDNGKQYRAVFTNSVSRGHYDQRSTYGQPC